jgi:hypothetical protein
LRFSGSFEEDSCRKQEVIITATVFFSFFLSFVWAAIPRKQRQQQQIEVP